MKRSTKLLWTAVFLTLVTPCVHAGTAEELFSKGEDAYHSGDYARAISLYEQAVEKDPNFAPVFNSLGLAHQAIGADFSDTVWFFKTAVQIDPKYAEAYTNMCRVYFDHQDFDAAEQSCLKALEISPGLGGVQLTLGWIYVTGKQEPKKAIYYFSEVLKRVSNPAIEYGLGMAYSMDGERAKVLDIVTRLRGVGQDQFAENLERTIRLYDSPEIIPGRGTIQRGGQESTLVGTSDTGYEPETQAEALPADLGQMRIRLRGTLTQTQTVEDNSGQPSDAQTEQHKSAAERIRELRRNIPPRIVPR